MDYCYKALNKTLITEVQAMRIRIAAYQKELNEAKEQMMNEHCLRVNQEKRFLQILTQSYLDSVLQVRPDTNCVHLIENNDNDGYNNNANCTKDRRLNSNNILNNFRRSMQLQSARRSLVSRSPIPRRRSIENDVSSRVDQMEASLSDLEQSSIVDVDADQQFDEQQQNFVKEEEEAECSDQQFDEQQQNFVDVVAEEEAECSEHEDNYNEEEEYETEETSITAAVFKLSLLEKINEEEDNENIEPAASKDAEKINLIHLKQPRRSGKSPLRDLTNCDDFLMRTSPPDLEDSFNLPLLTAGNQVVCSTPHNEIFKDEYSVKKANKSSDFSDECSVAITRPRRSCKPINLEERSLRVKLRNETDVKWARSKSSGKRKTKTLTKEQENS